MQPLNLGLVPAHYSDLLGGDANCLSYPDGERTWAQLESRANQLARLLAEHGVKQNLTDNPRISISCNVTIKGY